jgi:hypothetical protein
LLPLHHGHQRRDQLLVPQRASREWSGSSSTYPPKSSGIPAARIASRNFCAMNPVIRSSGTRSGEPDRVQRHQEAKHLVRVDGADVVLFARVGGADSRRSAIILLPTLINASTVEVIIIQR